MGCASSQKKADVTQESKVSPLQTSRPPEGNYDLKLSAPMELQSSTKQIENGPADATDQTSVIGNQKTLHQAQQKSNKEQVGYNQHQGDLLEEDLADGGTIVATQKLPPLNNPPKPTIIDITDKAPTKIDNYGQDNDIAVENHAKPIIKKNSFPKNYMNFNYSEDEPDQPDIQIKQQEGSGHKNSISQPKLLPFSGAPMSITSSAGIYNNNPLIGNSNMKIKQQPKPNLPKPTFHHFNPAYENVSLPPLLPQFKPNKYESVVSGFNFEYLEDRQTSDTNVNGARATRDDKTQLLNELLDDIGNI